MEPEMYTTLPGAKVIESGLTADSPVHEAQWSFVKRNVFLLETVCLVSTTVFWT